MGDENGSEYVLSRDEVFMGHALLAAKASHDPSTKVGACVVSDGRLVSVGHNHFPKSAEFPWGKKSDDPLETKYPYVVHAELDAILNARGETDGCSLFVVLFPCNECAKVIVQSGIREVVYLRDDRNDMAHEASKRMLDACHVKRRPIDYKFKEIILLFE